MVTQIWAQELECHVAKIIYATSSEDTKVQFILFIPLKSLFCFWMKNVLNLVSQSIIRFHLKDIKIITFQSTTNTDSFTFLLLFTFLK